MMKFINKILAILVIAILIISATGVSAVSNLTDENKTVNEVVELNETVNETIGQEKTKNILSANDNGKSKVTVIFHKMSSEGEVTSSITNEISSTWGIGMGKFDNQVANKKYSDFVYDNEHWVFDHWEDVDGNKITGTQTIVATGEDFEVHYYAKYTHTPLGTLRVKYNDNFGHGSSSMNYTDHNTAYKHTFKVPADYPEDKVEFKYWEREDTGQRFNAGDILTVKPSEFDGIELNITVNAIYEFIPCKVNLTYVDNVTGEIITSNIINIPKFTDNYTVEQTEFDNVVSNRTNITVGDRNYTFTGFNTTAPLTMEWQPNDYEVVVCLNYDEVIIPPEIDNDTDDNQTDDNQTIDNQTDDNQTDDNPVGDNNDTKINETNINPIMDNDSSVDDNSSNNTIPVKLLNTGYDTGVFLIACILLIVGLVCLRKYYS